MISFKNYLHNFMYDLNNHITYNIHKPANKYAKLITKKHNKLINLKKKYQKGGTNQELKNKVDKIDEILNFYNNVTKNIPNIENLIKQIDDVKGLLESTNTEDKINIDKIDQIVEYIETSINNIDNQIGINKRRNRLYVPKLIEETNLDIMDIFNMENINLKNFKNFNKINEEEKKRLNDLIISYIRQINDLIFRYSAIIETLKQKNETLVKIDQDSIENINYDGVNICIFHDLFYIKTTLDKKSNIITGNNDLNRFYQEIKKLKYDENYYQFYNNSSLIPKNDEIKKNIALLLYDPYNFDSNIADDNNKNELFGTYRNRMEFIDKYPAFNGVFIRKITNTLLNTETNLRTINEINEQIIKTNLLSDLKEPDFLNKLYNGITIQKGGTIDELNVLVKKFYKLINEYNELAENINKKYHNFVCYIIFLTLIIKNQIFTNNYIMYDYVNRNTLILYFRIINDIINNNDKDDVVITHIKKYYMMILNILHNFLNKIINDVIKMPREIISVNDCSDDIRKRFLLLNFFKHILENYAETQMNKITIYARINDIPTIGNDVIPLRNKDKIFFEKTQNDRMEIKMRSCNALRENPTNPVYNFTEVFDTREFPENSDISSYMSISTQLAKNKGVCLITYGYSGTGKTYTLFGNIGKIGLLQSTLNNISSMSRLEFRAFELYGIGLTYPYYWNEGLSNIEHKIYNYELELVGSNLEFKQVVSHNEIDIFINTNNYLSIESENSIQVLRSFNSFVEQIERKRKEDKRIRETPNNIVSSRSVMAYDFKIIINKENEPDIQVPFLILDLPGREDIYDTYVNNYMKNPYLQQIFPNENERKHIHLLLLISIINPVALPIFDLVYTDNAIYNIFLNILKNPEQKREILDKDIELDYKFDKNTFVGTRDISYLETGDIYEIKLGEKIISKIKVDENGIIIQRDDDNKNKNYKFFEEFVNLRAMPIKEIIDDNGNIMDIKFYGYSAIKEFREKQIKSLISVMFISRLIKLLRFDILENIIREICDKMINNKVNEFIRNNNVNAILDDLTTQYRQEYINDSRYKITNNGNILENEKQEKYKELCKNVLGYNYFITPFEGIYINENIIGMLQFLSDKLVTRTKNRIDIDEQDKSLTFSKQQLLARMMTAIKIQNPPPELFFGATPEETEIIQLIEIKSGKFEFNNNKVDLLIGKYNNIYRFDKIFNKRNPIIKQVLNHYLQRINDYKIFYLFGNYGNDAIRNFKCKQQFDLLQNTKKFVESIT